VAPGPPVRTAPVQAEIAAQASFDTGYLLALYMRQLAAAGMPPRQADIDEATQQYFTNGAAATNVPASGPGAAYFHNGAAAMGAPSSGPGAAYFHNGAEVTAYPVSGVTSKEGPAGQADGGVSVPASSEGDASVEGTGARNEPNMPAAPAPPQVRVPQLQPGTSCSPLEIQAAMALATQFANPSSAMPAASACPPTPPPRLVALPVEMASTSASGTEVKCLPAASGWSRVASALGGLLFGGLGVALWTRPRQLRAAPRR
jgi:hypothetical protein